MKKFIAALMTVLFLGSTGLVLADDAAAPATTPVAKTEKAKTGKKVKKGKMGKKGKKGSKGKKAVSTPVAETTPTK